MQLHGHISVVLNSTCNMRQGCGRFKATTNKFPVSIHSVHLFVSVLRGYNFTEINRSFQSLSIVANSIPPLSQTAQIEMKKRCDTLLFGIIFLRGEIPYKARGSELRIINSLDSSQYGKQCKSCRSSTNKWIFQTVR